MERKSRIASRPEPTDLLHLPDQPAGVEKNPRGGRLLGLAADLLHLPGKPAGVRASS